MITKFPFLLQFAEERSPIEKCPGFYWNAKDVWAIKVERGKIVPIICSKFSISEIKTKTAESRERED